MLDMAKVSKTYRINTDLLARMERWIGQQPVPPSDTAVVEKALEQFLDTHDSGKDDSDS